MYIQWATELTHRCDSSYHWVGCLTEAVCIVCYDFSIFFGDFGVVFDALSYQAALEHHNSSTDKEHPSRRSHFPQICIYFWYLEMQLRNSSSLFLMDSCSEDCFAATLSAKLLLYISAACHRARVTFGAALENFHYDQFLVMGCTHLWISPHASK